MDKLIKMLKKNLTAKDGVLDLEHWYNAYKGLAVAKRIQSPPVVVVSRHPFGKTEAQILPYYSKKYLEIKNSLLK